jgi:hypothetical protein
MKMPITEGNTKDNIKEQAKGRLTQPPPAARPGGYIGKGGFFGKGEDWEKLKQELVFCQKQEQPTTPRQRTTQLEKDLTRAIYELVTAYKDDTELQVKSIEINMVDIASAGSTRPEYAFGGVSVEVVV